MTGAGGALPMDAGEMRYRNLSAQTAEMIQALRTEIEDWIRALTVLSLARS
jgi:hypothetical protein